MENAVRKWYAKIGRKGGQSTSPAKIKAAVENGKKNKGKTKGKIPMKNVILALVAFWLMGTATLIYVGETDANVIDTGTSTCLPGGIEITP